MSISLLRNVSVLAATATLSLLAAPAHAGLTLNGTSGEWSNPNGGTAIQYKTKNDGTEQILWGDPAQGYATAGKSGLGFRGIGDLDLTVGEVFNLGRLTHYNKTIWSGTAASGADLQVDLDFGFGTQSFDFTMNIDETRNDPSYHNGGVCPYETPTGNFGCSDSITWSNSISANSFNIGTDEYKLDLVGFSDSLDASTIKTQFISQEGWDSHAHIFAKITQATPDIQDIPEPASLVGLGLVGFAAARYRRFKIENA